MDRDKLKELWDASAGIFMSGGTGRRRRTACSRCTGNTAEYWESPGKVATAIQLAKGLVTDGEPDLGDSGSRRPLSRRRRAQGSSSTLIARRSSIAA